MSKVFQMGERVIISAGEIGTKHKGTQSEINMIRMGTKCCEEGEIGLVTDSSWISCGGYGLYKHKRYQVNLGDEYGHLWFRASQMKRI